MDPSRQATEFFTIHDPSTGKPIARVPKCTQEEMNAAIAAAKAAFPGWKNTPVKKRAAIMRKLYTLIERDLEELTDEQIDRLTLHHKMGAATYVLVSFGLEDFYRIPWEVWRDMKAIYGRKYIKAADVEQYRVPYMSGVLKLLEGIETEYTKGADQ